MIGDRVWLDKNANGIQDEGEPDFTQAVSFTLRTFNGSNKTYTGSAPNTTSGGWYYFSDLYTAIAKSVDGNYDANGNADYQSLSGSQRYTYQVALDSVPEGYAVTVPYAENGGKATTYAVKADDSGLLLYSKNTADGHEEDSDFVLNGSTYTTTRFFLPLTRAEIKEGDDLVARYLTFDLGLVRIRDITLVKRGNNGQAVEGVTFDVYGPFYTEPTEADITADNFFTTLTATDSEGKTSFTSSQDKYLNYYAYYILVEQADTVPAPYTAEIVKVEGATKLTDTAVILAPSTATNSGTAHDDVVVTDKYAAKGQVKVDFTKALSNALHGESITDDAFAGKFHFTLTNTQGDDPAFKDGAKSLTNGADGTFSYTFEYTEPGKLTAARTYVYTLQETSTDITGGAVGTDSTVYTITVTVEDKLGDGNLTVTAAVSPDDKDNTFTDPLDYGDLFLAKNVQGSLMDTEKGDTFTFTVTMTPAEGAEDLLKGMTFDVLDKDGKKTGTITLDDQYSATVTITVTKAGSSNGIYIKNIPLGTKVNVSEQLTDAQKAAGYRFVSFSHDLPVTIDESNTTRNSSGIIVNNERYVGSAEISKTVAGNSGDKDDYYRFSIELSKDTSSLSKDLKTYANSLADTVYFKSYTATKTTASGKSSDVTVDLTSGSATVSLKDGEKLVIDELPVGAKLTVTEIEKSSAPKDLLAQGYTITVNGEAGTTATETLTADGGKLTYAFVNTLDVGAIKLTKVVVGTQVTEADTFEFTIKLTKGSDLAEGSVYPKTYPFVKLNEDGVQTGDGSITFDADGEATVELKAGETIAIYRIPTSADTAKQTAYTITETDYSDDGYATRVGETETLVASGKVTTDNYLNLAGVTYTNERQATGLSITKKVEGNSDPAPVESFSFTVGLKRADGKAVTGTYACEGAVTSLTFVTNEKTGYAEATFSLKANETVTINNILDGTQWTVAEADYTADGYTTTFNKTSGTLDLKTEEVTAVSVTNTRNVGELDITKAVVGEENPDLTMYKVTVKLTYNEKYVLGDQTENSAKWPTVSGAAGAVTYSKTGDHELTITTFIAKDGTIKIGNILEGTTYTVSEEDYKAYGFEKAVISGDTDAISHETIRKVAITNTRPLGQLTVAKAITDDTTENVALKDGYEFTVILTYPADVDIAITGNKPVLNGASVGTIDETAHTVTVTETIKATESFTLTNIPVGTEYKVYEGNADTGYELYGYKLLDAQKGTVTEEQSEVSLTFTNERYVGELDITKKVDGTENADLSAYEVTVVLTYSSHYSTAAENGNQPTVTGMVGNASITYQGNEVTVVAKVAKDGTLKLTGIPEGTTYTVTEADYKDYGFDPVSITGDIKTAISHETVRNVTVTNTRKLGSLTVNKAITDDTVENVSLDGEYDFTVILSYPAEIDMSKESNRPSLDGTVVSADTVNTEKHIITVTKTIKAGEKFQLTNIPEDTDYDVYEGNVDTGYYTEGYTNLGHKTGTITEKAMEISLTFTNERYVGELTIKKTGEGNAADLGRTFTFTVTLTRGDAQEILGGYPDGAKAGDTFTASDLTWTIGEKKVTATVELKVGETKTISDILAGTKYEVTEADYSALDYTTTQPENYKGEVGNKSQITVEYVNKRTAGALTLTKQVDSDRDVVEDYAFTLTLTYADNVDLTDEDNLPVTDPVVEPEINGQKVTYTFTLADGKSMSLTNILTGTEYAFAESSYYAYGFTAVKLNSEDEQAVAADAEQAFEQTGTVSEEGETYTWTVTNIRRSGDLLVTKTLAGNATDPEKEFNFTVYLYNTGDGIIADATYDAVKTLADGTEDPDTTGVTFTWNEEAARWELTFTLKGGESMLIKDITAGIGYEVLEDDYQLDGYLTTYTGAEGTIEAKTTAEADFINTRDLGLLKITKTLAGNAPVAGTFNVTVTLSRNDNVPVAGIYYTDDGDEVEFKAKADGSATATVAVKSGTTVTINDIPAGTAYKVVEADYTAQDYVTTYKDATGTIPVEGATAVVTNTRNTGSLTITKTVQVTGIPLEEVDRLFTFTVKITKADGTALTRVMDAVDGDGVASTVTFVNGTAQIRLSHGQKLTILDIPEGATYTVTEQAETGVTTTCTGDTGTMTTDGATADFINKITQAWMQLTVKKVWNEKEYGAKRRPTSISVVVKGGSYKHTFVLSDENDWTATTEKLPRFDAKGNVITYSVQEVSVPDGYRVKYQIEGTIVTVTNTRTDPFDPEIPDYPVALGAGINMNEGYCYD